MQRYRVPALVTAAYLGTFLATLDISIVNVALPTLQTALHADVAGLQWVINAYAIALSTLMLSAGPLGDRHGHKRVWLGSVLLFVLGSLICAIAADLNTLLWGRAIQGIAGALLIPAAMPILTHAFTEPHRRARAIGGWSAFSALALISGPLLGGLLVEHLGWQSVFLVNIPLGILAAGLGAWAIPERRHPEHAAFDPWGQVLCMLGLGMLSYGLIEIGQPDIAPVKFLLPLAIAALGLMAFVWVERRVQRPLFPVRLFQHRALAQANLASFALGFSGYASLFFLSIFLQQAQGHSPAVAGRGLLPQFLVMGATSLLFGRLAHRFQLRHLMVAGYGLVGLGLCSMVCFRPDTSAAIEATSLVVLGFGMGLSVPATGMTVMDYAPHQQAGIASATMNALRQTGMTLGIASLGSLMSLQAVKHMTRSMRQHGATGAETAAKAAIAHHQIPAGVTTALQSYRAAMASGFSVAILTAGLVSLVAAALLLGRPPTQSATQAG